MLIVRGEFCLKGIIDKRRSESGWLQTRCIARYLKLDKANVTNVDALLNLHSTTFAGDVLNSFDCAPVLFMKNIVRPLQCP